ncbi:MAG: efflux RND transporter permease subunit, partial [Acetobacteraceae bacterium]
MNLGISGRLTRASIRSPLTPLLLLAALALGLVAVLSIPREEDPQIHVPMVDILVNASGLKAPDAVQLVTKPLETIVKGIQGVRHVYSQTVDDQVMVTARFAVGTNEDSAILRVNEKVRDNYNRIPVGIPPPLIVGRGINDVAIVVLTLRPTRAAAGRWSAGALQDLATKLQQQIIKVPNIGLTYIVGAGANRIQIEPEPGRMMLRGITMPQLIAKVRDANNTFLAGGVVQAGRQQTVQAGHTLQGVPDIGLLLLTTRNGEPVYLRDVARVVVGPPPHGRAVWNYARGRGGHWHRTPAVSIAFAKRAGTNAVVIARDILAQVKSLEGSLIPRDIRVEVTRDYGRSANAKANDLLFHLGLATVSIVVLIAFAIGWREAMVTLVVIPTTILLTLFASWMMGYTLNRVSLFALIFAIGILVDDAIVVVENIARHWAMHDGRPRTQAAIEAVAEVGNPTVFATLAVIAALLPMLSVSGMMGPYMAPIPVNASAAMLFSFFVAMMLAPWLMLRLSKRSSGAGEAEREHEGALGRIYRRVAGPLLATRARAWTFLLLVGAATIAVCALFYTEAVTVKLLPFDNKSEMQLVLDLPPGATLQDTERVLFGLARVVGGMREVKSMQAYAGTAAPFDFNGLVRHYYARSAPQDGQLQIELVPKGARSLESHAIALRLRQRLKHFPLPAHAVLRLVEPPPGPPVLATLIAEVYGPNAKVRRAVAQQVKAMFRRVPFIVDVGDSYGHRPPMLSITIDEGRLEYFGVEQSDVYDTIRSLFGTTAVGYSHRGREHPPVPIEVGL